MTILTTNELFILDFLITYEEGYFIKICSTLAKTRNEKYV